MNLERDIIKNNYKRIWVIESSIFLNYVVIIKLVLDNTNNMLEITI